MSLKRRITIGVLWTLAGNWAEQGCAFIIFAIMARLLDAEVFGLVAMALIVVGFAEVLIRQSMTEALIQRQQLEPGHLDAAFWSLLALAAGLTLGIVALADVVARVYGISQVADLLRWLSPTLLFVALSAVPVAILRRNLQFRLLAVCTTLGMIAGGAVGITMAVMDYGVWSLVGQRLAQIFVTSMMIWLARPWHPGFHATRHHFRDLRTFGLGMLGVRLTETISLQTPGFMIGYLLGPVALGYFTIAWRITEVVLILLVQPFQFVALPAFAKVQNNLTRAGEMLQGIIQAVTLISFSAFIGLAMVAPQAIVAGIGAGWEPAIPLLQILCMVGVYMSIERFHKSLLLGLGHVGWVFALTLLDAALGIVILFIAAQFDVFAVAVAFAARDYFFWPLHLYVFQRLTRVDVKRHFSRFLPALVAALIMAIAVLGWQHLMAEFMSRNAMLASTIALGFVTYASLVFVAMPARVRRATQILWSILEPAEHSADFDRLRARRGKHHARK